MAGGSGASEQRTLWEHDFCPLFGGCPLDLVGGSNRYRKYHNNFNRCHNQCPLYRGCPLVGGSIIGGSTVV